MKTILILLTVLPLTVFAKSLKPEDIVGTWLLKKGKHEYNVNKIIVKHDKYDRYSFEIFAYDGKKVVENRWFIFTVRNNQVDNFLVWNLIKFKSPTEMEYRYTNFSTKRVDVLIYKKVRKTKK
jgi:hypothetical protein